MAHMGCGFIGVGSNFLAYFNKAMLFIPVHQDFYCLAEHAFPSPLSPNFRLANYEFSYLMDGINIMLVK